MNSDLTKVYYNRIKAPLKGFYTFEHSAHGPLFEETEKVKLIIEEDILKNRINPADR